jgi:8-oxo-dGTP pyrophosphatase MutT (NUDIX family)
MQLKKWKLISKKDVSPSKWFPIEERTYELPDGTIIDNFYVTTLADSVHIIPITADRKVVLIQMYKQGTDEIMIQFPAGRFEAKHSTILEGAVQELEEETGIQVVESDLKKVGKLAAGSTKQTECVHIFIATGVSFNSKQNLDETEEITVLSLSFTEMEEYITSGKIWDSHCIVGWELAKKRFPKVFSRELNV